MTQPINIIQKPVFNVVPSEDIILLEYFRECIQENIANEVPKVDGYNWTCQTLEEIQENVSVINPAFLKIILKELIAEGCLVRKEEENTNIYTLRVPNEKEGR